MDKREVFELFAEFDRRRAVAVSLNGLDAREAALDDVLSDLLDRLAEAAK